MKGKGGMALMIAIGKKKPGMGEERGSSPSLGSESEDEDMGMDSMGTLEPLAKAFFEAGARGKFKQAAQLFQEMQKACGEDYEEDD